MTPALTALPLRAWEPAGPLDRPCGASLAEALVALALVGIALLATAGLFSSSARGIRSASNRTRALSLATSLASRLDALGHAQLPSWLAPAGCRPGTMAVCRADTSRHPPLLRWQPRVAALADDARATVEVSSVGGGPLSEARALRVEIVVAWREGGRERSVSVQVPRL